ncbi:MAG TPA: CarD family transcriptional regulator [Cellulomonas sp.]
MPFSQGQTIIHPHHGPVRVDRLVERTVGGQTRTYLDLTTLDRPLSISVPVDRAEDVGLRAVCTPARVAELLGLLASTERPARQPWARRIKDLQERLSRGEPDQTCRVIRELTRSGVRPGATAEGQLLRTARSHVAGELAVALRIELPAAERVIDSALDGDAALAATA